MTTNKGEQMKKYLALFCCIFFLSLTVFAQTNEDEQDKDAKTEELYVYKMNQKGDWFVKLGGAAFIPLQPNNMNLGLDLNLGFYRFLWSEFSLGGDIRVTYASTVGKNMFFSIPLMARGIYQFSFKDFEIPLSLGVGISIQNYIDRYYFGLIVNPEAGFFWRFKSDWSVGAHLGLNIMPQWYGNKDFNRTGYFLDTGLSVRYHF
jgi:hypothetical protein